MFFAPENSEGYLIGWGRVNTSLQVNFKAHKVVHVHTFKGPGSL